MRTLICLSPLPPASLLLTPLPRLAFLTVQVKILHDELKWCYFKEGVNHLENCKELVKTLAAKLRAPYYGMPGAPSTEW